MLSASSSTSLVAGRGGRKVTLRRLSAVIWSHHLLDLARPAERSESAGSTAPLHAMGRACRAQTTDNWASPILDIHQANRATKAAPLGDGETGSTGTNSCLRHLALALLAASVASTVKAPMAILCPGLTSVVSSCRSPSSPLFVIRALDVDFAQVI